MRANLMKWQWDGYPEFHTTKLNLWLHVFAVPAFIASALSLVVALVTMRWMAAGSALAGMIVAFALQAVGHKKETTPPIPFEGPLDVVSRIFVEQFVTFPRFVLSGGLSRAWRAARAARQPAAREPS